MALPDSPAALIAVMNQAAAKLTEASFASMSGQEILDAAEANEHMRARVEAATTNLMIELNDQELAADAGIALTATGTQVPMTDLIEVAAHATPTKSATSHAANASPARPTA